MNEHQKRAKELLAKMTIEEKAAQLYSVWLVVNEDGSFTFRNVGDGFIKDSADDPKEVMKTGIGQITRPLGTRPIEAKRCVRGLNLFQKQLIEQSRLGIPALFHEECLPGLMAKGGTLFPAAINFGATWNDELMLKIAKVIGDEMYAVGAKQGLAPVLDVCRDARWGRTEETFGEDPFLVGCMAKAYVEGLQGKDRRIAATLKHYVGHSFSEGARNHAPVRVGEKELNDVFLLPFEMAVKLAHADSIMPAYHDIDGEPSSSSYHYLTEVLRNKWGFDGTIVSDYGAVKLLMAHHKVAADETEAAALALKAGMDVELPDYTCFRKGIPEAIDRGLVDIELINAKVERILTQKSRLGLFDRPYIDEDAVELNTPEHKKTAKEAADESIVLLKNDGTLPLADSGKTAVIGPSADDQLSVFCGYSFPVHLIIAFQQADNKTTYAKTILQGIKDRAAGSSILYKRGCDILTRRPKDAPVFPGDVDAEETEQKTYVSCDESGIAEAVETAKQADRIVVTVGDLAGLFLSGTVGEGSDASSLRLPGVQEKLLDALLALNKPLIVVIVSGRPYNIGAAYEKANAVLQAWLPGQEGADAIASVLYGDVDPSGRLPVSIPKTAGAMPYFYNTKLKSAGTPIQADFGALFPFGHGLSYTDFRWDEFSIRNTSVPIDGDVVVSVTVGNTGKREGSEVVQLYVRDEVASLVRPIKELKGFKKVFLRPGEKRRISFVVPVDMFGFTVTGEKRMVEPGDMTVMLGRSSAGILFQEKITITGEARELPEQWRMVPVVTVS